MTKFPILLSSDFSPSMVLHPLAFRLTEKLTPLSTASITLPDTAAEQVPLRSFVRLTSPQGDAGVYRVVSRTTNAGLTTELSLQHGLCSLSDHMHPGESEETSPCRVLLEKLLENQDIWVLGTVDVPDDEPLTWKCSNTNDLQGLTDIMKELPGYYLDFSQDTLPWVLHVRKKPESIACEARFDRNVMDAQIAYDTSEMCNVAYAKGLEEPITADTVETWGPIARNFSADDDLPQEVLVQTAERYLEQKKNPQVTITLTALALSRITGEPFDSFRIGMLCRCILPEMTTVQRIEAIDWKDPLGVPEDVVLTLSSTQKDMSATVAGLVVDTRVRFDRMQKKLRLEAEQIEMLAKRIDVCAVDIAVNAVNIGVNAENIGINAKNIKANADLIQLNAGKVKLELDKINDTLTAQAGTINLIANDLNVAAENINVNANNISAQAKTIEAKADTVRVEAIETEITGLLKVENLQAAIANLSVLSNGSIQSDYVDTTDLVAQHASVSGSFSAGTAKIGGSSCGLATLTIGDKSCTFFAPADATFDLSDMPGYDDALAAARTEGASSVSVSDIDLYDVQYGKTTKTISASLDVILSTNATSKHSISVDASKAYNAGHSDGYDAGESAGYTAGQKAGAQTLTLSPSTSTTLDYGASQTVTATTSYGSATVTKTVTLTAPADRYSEGLLLGMKAFKTTSVSVEGTLSDDYNYTLSVTCTNETGANSWTFSVPFSAKDAYDKGWEAAKGKITVSGSITSLYSVGPGYYRADGWAGAKLDGTTVKETTFSKVQQIS